jgi:hypothetical protein
MRSRIYIWVTGMDARGALTTAGPYESETDAEDATEHLSQTQFHRLHTRQHDKARRLLRERMSHGRSPRHSDEPADDEEREHPGAMDRIRGMLGKRNREEREFGE